MCFYLSSEYITPFNILCQAGLVIINSVIFLFLRKFCFSFILMDCFPRYSSLYLKEWVFRVCNTSFYDVLALNMSVEESEVILMVLSLQVTQPFYIELVNTLPILILLILFPVVVLVL